MLYVMCRMNTYIEDLESSGKAIKMGFREKSKVCPQGFLGTYVFETYDDAEDFIRSMSYSKEGFEVFGIEADWDKDTYKISETCKWKCLIKDTEYFSIPQRLVDTGEECI